MRVGIRTTFLGNVFQPWLIGALTFCGISILGALVVSAFVANLALQPIEQISERLDVLTQAESRGRAGIADHRAIPWCRYRTRSSASAAACATWKRFSRR